jgi:SurA-like N-terminal domain
MKASLLSRTSRRALVLLATGAVLGIALGVLSAFSGKRFEKNTLPDDAIAVVNGKAITMGEYASAVALLAGDKRTALTDEDRLYVLNRLIEEELLVQRGIEIGLVDSDRTVRKTIAQAMLASVVTDSVSARPSQEELRAFYQKNPSLFASSSLNPNIQATAGGNAGKLPLFEEVHEQVEAMYLQHARDEALQEYLQWLRDEAKIAIAPEFSR